MNSNQAIPEKTKAPRPSPPHLPRGNPFSTRHVRPGAVEFFFSDQATAGDLIDRLAAGGWWGEIVGPHGSGKSTLLAALLAAVEKTSWRPVLVELHDGQRKLPIDLHQAIPAGEKTLVVIDGYEQLSNLARYRVKRFCRRRGCGLLATAHESVGLPPLVSTQTTPALARQVVSHLTRETPIRFADDEVDRLFAAREGNLREVLFDLYDLYEARCDDDSGASHG